MLFFYFIFLNYLLYLKRKRIKRELINVCSCLFNKFKSLRSLKILHCIRINIAYHGITSHNRYIEDWFSHSLAIYFSRNGSRTDCQRSSGSECSVPGDVHQLGPWSRRPEEAHQQKEEGRWRSQHGKTLQRWS